MRKSPRFGSIPALLLAVVLAQTLALAHDHSHHHGVDAVDCALVHYSTEGKAAPGFTAPVVDPVLRNTASPALVLPPLVRRPSAATIRAPPSIA